MLNIYHSNQLDVLKELIAYLIEAQPLDDPMAKEIIVVQSSGMARWLQIELGQSLNILANTEFPLPATFIWRIFTKLLRNETQSVDTQYNKITMTWLLMRIIPTLLDEPAFSVLKTYLADDQAHRKLHQLAGRCADLFDHYLVYRPEWMSAWESGKTIADLSDEQAWQAPLWQAIVHTFNSEFSNEDIGIGHRAELYEQLITLLESAQTPLTHLPQRFFICGIAALPPLYVRALEVLGRHCEVHLMYTNPCKYYWADIQDLATKLKQRLRVSFHHVNPNNHPNQKSLFSQLSHPLKTQHYFELSEDIHQTHPLLANWGKLARDQLYQFAELSAVREIDAFVEKSDSTLLSRVQNDLLNLQNRVVFGLTLDELSHSHTKQAFDELDESISFHVCHSPLREVEVLHDNLLAKLEADPALNIRDIVVMVADISAYSPYIQAVFGNAPTERYLPFSISDRAVKQLHPIIDAVSRLMSVGTERFQVESIITLLSVSALAKKFNILADDLPVIEQWISEANIYWGKDDVWMDKQSLTPTGQFTWRFGLNRLFLGLTKTVESGVWQEISPLEQALKNPDLAGHLDAFIETLFAWQARIATAFPLVQWQSLFNELISAFFCFDDTDEAKYANDADESLFLAMQQAWNEVIDAGLTVHFDEPVVINILHQEWLLKIDNEKVSQRFLVGKINFCTLMPMRSVPFKVVCLLGMNEGVYPRTVVPMAFDLVAKHPKRGDRSRRDDDRYLFLEALLAAQEVLYISYVGLSIQNNTTQNPSVLVNELLDYLAYSYVRDADRDLPVDESKIRLREYLLRIYPRVPYAKENYRLVNDHPNLVHQKPVHHNPVQQDNKPATDSFNRVSKVAWHHQYTSFAKEWLPIINIHQADKRVEQGFMLPLKTLANALQQHNDTLLGSVNNLDLTKLIDISLNTLGLFYKNPVEYYFKQRLGIYLKEPFVLLENDEPFSLDSLQKYPLKDRLFKAQVKSLPIQFVKKQLRAEGVLPVGMVGEKLLEEAESQSQLLCSGLTESLGDLTTFISEQEDRGYQTTFSLDFFTHKVHVLFSGSFNIHPERGLVDWRMGKLSAKYQLDFWIKHLLYCYHYPRDVEELTAKQQFSTLYGFNDKNSAVIGIQFDYLDVEQAQSLLNALFKTYLLGQYQPVWCLVQSCTSVADQLLSSQEEDVDSDNNVSKTLSAEDLQNLDLQNIDLETLENALWSPGQYKASELDNPYVKRVFDSIEWTAEDSTERFKEIIFFAKHIHLPMLENIRQ